jgi:hypothetical protein
MVRLMHRPDPFDREDPRGGEADIILGKHRSGPTAEFCHWRKAERIAEDRDRLAHNPEIAASDPVPATHCPRSAASEVRCERTAGLKDRLGMAGNRFVCLFPSLDRSLQSAPRPRVGLRHSRMSCGCDAGR